MNLLFYRYGSICEPDIIEGFRELGNQVTEITLEIYNKNLGPLEGLTALKNELFAHSYDFVFSINYYPFISEICNSRLIQRFPNEIPPCVHGKNHNKLSHRQARSSFLPIQPVRRQDRISWHI